MDLSAELQEALLSCYMYSLTEQHLPERDRLICFSWAERLHRTEFERSFHNSHLRHLARLGLLAKADTSRHGNRRYYHITEAGLRYAQQIQQRPCE